MTRSRRDCNLGYHRPRVAMPQLPPLTIGPPVYLVVAARTSIMAEPDDMAS